MAFKFEKLEIWQQSVDYVDLAYDLAGALPKLERYNLSDQLRRAATSVSLNIAEGSTGQTDKEQSRFLGIALRSLLETVACIHIIKRRKYCKTDEEKERLSTLYQEANHLAARIQAMRNSLSNHVGEEKTDYLVDD
ncbi:four helix bundle protein [Fodinibius halophilus]|uniref:Four helix bundle protein n=1 Tax=Fodinibius halophilus TaxID=1736908 RepID=A0A6M1T0T8_9BACT|nr:four helix bundle protein [Fodinibius halophilus]NGP89106.1 four helix bundle protein [Fodinibius halophilus]